MLSVNLCVQYALFNGAMGIVRDIIYKDNTKTTGLPDVVLVEFPGYTGPLFIPENPKNLFRFILLRDGWIVSATAASESKFHSGLAGPQLYISVRE